MRAAAWKATAGLLAFAACGVPSPPYQPATLPVPAAPDAATERRILAVFTRFFPRPERLEWAPLRVASTWTDDRNAGDTPVQNRGILTVTPSGAGALVEVVVQQQALRQDPFQLPAWHAAGANRELEEQLVEALEAELSLVPPAETRPATRRQAGR